MQFKILPVWSIIPKMSRIWILWGQIRSIFWGGEVLSSVPVEKPHLGSTSVRIWVPQNMDSQHWLIAKKYQQTQTTHPRKDRKG